MRGGIDPGDHRFHPRFVGVVEIRKNLLSGDEYTLRVALRSTNPSQSAITQRGWVSTPCMVVSTRGVTGFVPGLMKLELYGGISDPRLLRLPLAPRAPFRYSADSRTKFELTFGKLDLAPDVH